jgi:hypothetical protein
MRERLEFSKLVGDAIFCAAMAADNVKPWQRELVYLAVRLIAAVCARANPRSRRLFAIVSVPVMIAASKEVTMSDSFDLDAAEASRITAEAENASAIFGIRNSLPDKALMDAVREHHKLKESVYGSVGTSMVDAISSMRGMRGIDDGMLEGIKGQLERRDAVSEILHQEISRAKEAGALGASDEDTFDRLRVPELPPMPRNPIIETNELLSEVGDRLDDQRALIAVSAQAQEQSAQLIAQLVSAFAASQAASDAHARKQLRQAWIGIFIAIATAIFPVVVSLFG